MLSEKLVPLCSILTPLRYPPLRLRFSAYNVNPLSLTVLTKVRVSVKAHYVVPRMDCIYSSLELSLTQSTSGCSHSSETATTNMSFVKAEIGLIIIL